jgi:hypothetical protein
MHVNSEKLAWLTQRLVQSMNKRQAGAELPETWKSRLV